MLDVEWWGQDTADAKGLPALYEENFIENASSCTNVYSPIDCYRVMVNTGGMPVPSLSKLQEYPALTVGLVIFTFLLLVYDVSLDFSLSYKFALYPDAPLSFDLNRLSFYLLFHQGLFHWALNIASLVFPLALFEQKHGTIHTGITLNLLAVITGLQFCIVGHFLYPETHVIGLSGVVFSFISYIAFNEHKYNPILYQFKVASYDVDVPTLYGPFIYLIVTSIIFPGSAFFGHLFGITTGFMLGAGYIKPLYPPVKIVLFIEDKLARPIAKLNQIVHWVHEKDAQSSRSVVYEPLLSTDPEAPRPSNPFPGEGNVLSS